MSERFTILDHPSDVGILAVGDSRERALELAAEGVVSIMADSSGMRRRLVRPLEARSLDEAALPILWLNEILCLFDAEYFLFSRFAVDRWSPDAIQGRGWGEPFDAEVHELRTSVKAITYHQYICEQGPDNWELQIFLDI